MASMCFFFLSFLALRATGPLGTTFPSGHWKREPSAGGARAGIFRLGPHPCTRPHSCRRPGTAGAPAGAVKHIEAINLKRPAFALDHIHAGVPAWPVRPPLRQSYRG
ncbi:hypothetical protein NDU88_006245 [Pleurodeles waltl]|uniref:Secreted protein n=1 Tax=Pleurodeles waltl TaxID=8319 RepID=A0AAV7MJA5_PLEWA|nr:hypothetical protein NDU88_006245 [Pleurodeles waltl]